EFSTDPQLAEPSLNRRQETVFVEAAGRIRKYAGLAEGKRFGRPMIIVVPKADVWAPLIGLDISTEPFVAPPGDNVGSSGVDVGRVERASRQVRAMLMQYAPEFVTAVEEFAETVVYVPVSALGRG